LSTATARVAQKAPTRATANSAGSLMDFSSCLNWKQERDDLSSKRHPAPAICLSMLFSQPRGHPARAKQLIR
jgi:hypothetical protein